MNRITQAIHGKGTISSMVHEKQVKNAPVSNRYLAYTKTCKPVVFWNITARCNLACSHCYLTSGPGRVRTNELSTAEALAFIDDCATIQIPVLLLSGGEPLLREDIWELAGHATARGISVALSTNGTLITSKVAKSIHRAGIGYAGISLDGASPDTHDRFRNKKGAFADTLRAFTNCQDAGVRTGVRVTLTRNNYHELEDLIRLSLSLGASRFCVYWLVPSGRGTDSYEQLQLSAPEILSSYELLYRYAKKTDPEVMEFLSVDAPEDAVYLLALMQQDKSRDYDEAVKLLSSMKGGCSAGIRVASMNHLGDVYPCQFSQDPEFLVGSIRERPFSRIWNDEKNPVLALFRNKNNQFTGRCQACSHLSLCGGGCRVRAYRQRNVFGDDDPLCFVDTGSG